ncbi:hypothetical protein E2C01_012498 [Portunus trituberculatus]|uniref:Uncharacterized protein n=1 Tax=Portunus trituberculatus TaxID=210409 RepID=A0A5B7DE14_PORTR|nr:hypothetical protein [Portunus trituberculatus]
MRLFVPPSKRGGPELGSVEKRPDTAGPHDVAGDAARDTEAEKLTSFASHHYCLVANLFAY